MHSVHPQRPSTPARRSDNQTIPASWAQAARLRNQERYGSYDALYKVFFADSTVTVEELAIRIGSIINDEQTYRITGGERAGDGTMLLRLAAETPPEPVEVVNCAAPSDVEAWCRRAAARRFRFDDHSPLWRAAIFVIDSVEGLAVGFICDHLITDGRSLWLFEQAIRAPSQRSSALAKPYLSWAERQRIEFGSEPTKHGRDASEFWRRYLDGKQADAPTRLDFALPSKTRFDGVAVTVCRPIRPTLRDLRRVATAHEVLPLSVILASVCHRAMVHALDDELSLRYITHGRPPGYSRTHGFFADSLPFLADASMRAGGGRAIARVGHDLAQAARYQDTPWDYIRTECGGRDADADTEPGDRQLVVNLVPYDVDQWPSGPTEPLVRHEGHIESLHIIVAPHETALGRVSATFNPSHFDIAGVEDLMGGICASLDALA